jgi:hypothetical protein
MLNRPAFFALLGATGMALVGYGCELEEREPPPANPRPGGGNAIVAAGPGAGSSGGGGGGGGTTTSGTTAITTGGEGGGDGGGGGAQTPAEQLFPFCGCLEQGGEAGACADCLWSVQVNGCDQEDLNCNQSANCLEIKQVFLDGLCADVTPMCIESAIQGLEGGVGAFALYAECACTFCSAACTPSACQ